MFIAKIVLDQIITLTQKNSWGNNQVKFFFQVKREKKEAKILKRINNTSVKEVIGKVKHFNIKRLIVPLLENTICYCTNNKEVSCKVILESRN